MSHPLLQQTPILMSMVHRVVIQETGTVDMVLEQKCDLI